MSTADRDTLHILSIFHYIMAGIIAFIACIPLIHLALGITMTVGGFSENLPVLGFAGAIFSAVAGLIILTGWGLAVLVFLAGRNLDRQLITRSACLGQEFFAYFCQWEQFWESLLS
ncbi:MAG: hypothetical protein KAR40_08490 [Candidatus Sabulitectum sp.]|nr:hypothetical protein [Candidatus Sabulitectum sp.]